MHHLEKKEDLIAALKAADESQNVEMLDVSVNNTEDNTQATPVLSPEDLRELATIADEMRHLRKQWILQASKSSTNPTHLVTTRLRYQ